MNYPKYIYILAFALLKFTLVSAQSTYFNRMIEYSKEHHFTPQIANVGSKLFTLTTVEDSVGPGCSVYLSGHDSSGVIKWTKRFSYQDQCWNTERTLNVKDSFLYFIIQITPVTGVSNVLNIYKVNVFGDIESKYEVQISDSVRIYNSKILEDGTFVNTGFRYVTKHIWFWFINRVDTNGNELFYKEYEWGGRNIGATVDRAPDGGYVMGGNSRGYNPDSLIQAMIIKTDSVGNIEWVRDFGDKWMDNKAYTTITKEGKIIATMQLNVEGDNSFPWDGLKKNRIMCLDMNGQVLWKKFIGKVDEIYPTNARYPEQLRDGNIVVYGGERDLYAGIVGYLHKFSPSTGDSIWSRNYRYLKNTWTDHYLRDVTELPNGNLALAGFFDPFGDTAVGTSANRMWILGVDSLGCLFPGCDTVCKKFKLKYTVTHDSGYRYHVEIKDPVVNSYALIYYDGYHGKLIGNSYKLNFDITFPEPDKYLMKFYGENKCIISTKADTVITVEEPLGINVGRKRSKIKIYPNPARGYIKVFLPHGTAVRPTYRLVSLAGRVIRSGSLPGDGRIALSDVSRGMYQLLLYDEEGILIERGKVMLE